MNTFGFAIMIAWRAVTCTEGCALIPAHKYPATLLLALAMMPSFITFTTLIETFMAAWKLLLTFRIATLNDNLLYGFRAIYFICMSTREISFNLLSALISLTIFKAIPFALMAATKLLLT
jgi:hypothetical protein